VPFLASDLQFVNLERNVHRPFCFCSLLVRTVRSHSMLINWPRVHNYDWFVFLVYTN